MAIVAPWVGTALTNIANALTVTVNYSGATDGEVVFLCLGLSNTQTPLTVPTGWTLLSEGGSSSAYGAVFWRVKQAGDTTVVPTWPTSCRYSTVAVSWAGVNTTTPTEGVVFVAHTAAGANFPTGSITPTVADCWIAASFFGRGSVSVISFIPDAAMIERSDLGNTASAFIANQVTDTAGTVTAAAHTYTSVATPTSVNHGGAFAWALIPASGGGTTPVEASRSTTWNTNASIFSTNSTTWVVSELISSARSTTWAINNIVSTTRDTTWNINAVVTSTKTATWNIKESIASVRSTTWNVKTSVSNTRTATWNVVANANSVIASRNTTWNVFQTTTSVSSTRSTTWDTKSVVANTKTTTWNDFAYVVSIRNTTWDVKFSTVSARVTSWNVKAALSVTRSATWNVRALVSPQRITMWNTNAAIINTRITTWDVKTSTASSRETTWNITQLATATRIATWNVEQLYVAKVVSLNEGRFTTSQINGRVTTSKSSNGRSSSSTIANINSRLVVKEK